MLFDVSEILAAIRNSSISSLDLYKERLAKAKDFQSIATLKGHRYSVTALAILPDGRIVSGSRDNTLRIWDANTQKCLATLTGHTACVNAVAVLSDGRIVSSSDDSTLRIWDANTQKCLGTLKGRISCVNAVAVLPDGRIVSGSADNTLRIWDANTLQCLATLNGQISIVSALAVLPDGRIVSGSRDRTLRIWDANTHQCIATLNGHTSYVTALAVLPDGRIVSGSHDNTLRIWDAKSLQCIATLNGHTSYVRALAVLPDGRIVSGSEDNTLRIWDAKSLQCIATLNEHTSCVRALAVLPDGRIVSGSADETLRVWDNKMPQLALADVDALITVLKSNASVKSLNLAYSSVNDEVAVMLAELLEVNSTLRKLPLICNKISKEGLQVLADALERNYALTEVSVDNHCPSTKAAISELLKRNNEFQLQLVQATKNGNSADLKQLLCDKNLPLIVNEADQTLRHVAAMHGQTSILNWIDNSNQYARSGNIDAQDKNGNSPLSLAILHGHAESTAYLLQKGAAPKFINIGVKGAAVLNGALKKGNILNSIDLQNNQLSDAGADSIANLLKDDNFINAIKLENNKISAVGANSLAEMLAKNKTLQQLYLGNNVFAKEGIQALSRALADNHSLLTLSLTKCSVDYEGVKAIADMLIQNTGLKELDLSHNNLGFPSVKKLLDSLSKNKTLQVLNLDGNNVDTKVLAEINIILDRNKIYCQHLEQQKQEEIANAAMFKKLETLQPSKYSLIAHRDYNAQNPHSNRLSFQAGELIEVLDDKGRNENEEILWLCRHNGKEGFVKKEHIVDSRLFQATLLPLPERREDNVPSTSSLPSSAPQLNPFSSRHNTPVSTSTAVKADTLLTKALSKQKLGGVDAEGNIQLSLTISYAELTAEKLIGKGGFGEVYKGSWRHMDVAIKKLHVQQLSLNTLEEFKQETTIMARLRCPYIVQLYGISLEPYCMVMEYAENGSLYSYLHSPKSLNWPLRLQIAQDMAKGLAFLHHEKILHRDIKSHNVLLDDRFRAKLADFGLSKLKTETSSSTKHDTVGTLMWMAPELFQRRATYTQACDIYSYGITLWEVASRELPFADAHGNQSLVREWVKDGERDDLPEDCPKSYGTIVKQCWDSNASLRPTASRVIEMLKEVAELESPQSTVPSPSVPSYPETTRSSTSTNQSSANSYKNNLNSGAVTMTSYPSTFFSSSASSTSSNAPLKQERNNPY